MGQPRTDGPSYDRNPSVVQQGDATYLFFARSRMPCNRLTMPGDCPDQIPYDLFVKTSTNGGRDYGPARSVTANPVPLAFRGRTVAATQSAAGDGGLYVFWADGGTVRPLYLVRVAAGAPPSAPELVPGAPSVFNVEAVTMGLTTYVYTEEAGAEGSGIYVRTFDGAAFSAPKLVVLDRNIPKALVDVNGGVKLTYVDARGYPTVNVHVASSPDGLNFVEHPGPVVSEPGVSNWDPQLTQKPNGQYYLFFAPDREEGAGSQRVALTKSNDFVTWSAPHEITPGQTGGEKYWD